MMDQFSQLVGQLNSLVWGVPMLVLILGVGLYLLLGLRLMPWLRIPSAFKNLWQGRKRQGSEAVTPFNALMMSLSATVGTGNIAGVATAIFLGGPGALFWMWCTALVGMATKYSEAVCAVHFREKDSKGNPIGGPMYYIKNGLGKRWHWLAGSFAVFGMLAGFGIGNAVQANSVADALHSQFEIPVLYTGIVMAILVAIVLIGGIRWLAEVAGHLVPFMAVAYLLIAVSILISHAAAIPDAFATIFYHAFNPTAAAGGFAGATVWMAIRFGVARGVFSNEAGLGSAPIAHASAHTNQPVRQGMIAMLGTFIDTLIICTLTGLVIIVSGAWTSGENGAALSLLAFEQSWQGVGSYIVTLGLAVFAFTTVLGWSLYGERCTVYLFGEGAVLPFRIAWVLMIIVGAAAHAHLSIVWLIADTLNALMALPNLIALALLSPVVFRLSRDYFAKSTEVS